MPDRFPFEFRKSRSRVSEKVQLSPMNFYYFSRRPIYIIIIYYIYTRNIYVYVAQRLLVVMLGCVYA